VRIGYVGIGGMGSAHVRNLLRIPGCRITAVCDVNPERTAWAVKAITEAGHPAPAVYARGPRDFERLCAEEDLDLVYNATPWEWHVPICLAAMRHGKHAAVEVPAAMTVDDCWALVEAAEKHQRHCVMMENCNYGRMEMLAFHLVRQGLFGEILHGEGATSTTCATSSSRLRRGAVAARVVVEAERQPLPHPRPRSDRQLHGHQPRRSLRLPRVDERPVARPPELGRGALSRRCARSGARSSCSAT
jgi:hypothetical protein